MKLSKRHLKTLREAPKEAELVSHQLLIRANLVRKVAAGIYEFMPLGYRSLRKVENIVREELDRIGDQEILMPGPNPAELWKESGRWYAYGPELWRIKDRNGRDFCLGPTHEETVTDIARNEFSSYRELPQTLYQIQWKYRDEARPRYGLLRSREFLMSDGYSFDRDEAGMDVSYMNEYGAYERIFTRCGLDYRIVEADNGPIGGSRSHEFSALSNVGESELAHCPECGYAATLERAECVDDEPVQEEMEELKSVYTPGTKTIEDVCNYLHMDVKKSIKALMFVTYDDELNPAEYVCAFVRGDREVNMIKLVNALGIPEHYIEFANEDEMGATTGCVGGFTGPVGLQNCKIVVDSELVGTVNMCAGANQEDHHMTGVCYGRDYKGDIVTDIKVLKEGERCPKCGKPIIEHSRGIEVGQIFKLGTKYSESMKAFYKDENGNDCVYQMGCYGIGITRTLQAVIEQHNDENGIIWPISVAPYHVMITVINPQDETQMNLANKIEEELEKAGVEVLCDDRDERPGVKFKDADLLGLPIRITVGKKAGEGIVEYKLRREGEMVLKSAEDATKDAIDLVNAERFGL